MRIGGEAPGGEPILPVGICVLCLLPVPATSDRQSAVRPEVVRFRGLGLHGRHGWAKQVSSSERSRCAICRDSHDEIERFERPMIAISARLAASRLHYAWVIIALTFVVIVVTAGVRATPGLPLGL